MEFTLFELLNEGAWVYAGAADSPEVSEALEHCADLCFEINSTKPSMKKRRQELLCELLGSIGSGCVIHSPFRCDFGSNIRIGDEFIGNFNLSILDEAAVNIGSNVMIGPNCCITTIMHALDPVQRRDGLMRAKPVTIADNVWIAAGVTIMPGVEIGEGAVIGAGSVVTKSIPARMLAFGNPCRPVREITDDDRIDITDCRNNHGK